MLPVGCGPPVPLAAPEVDLAQLADDLLGTGAMTRDELEDFFLLAGLAPNDQPKVDGLVRDGERGASG